MTSVETLELIEPSIEYSSQYLAMVDEHIETGEGYRHNNIDLAKEKQLVIGEIRFRPTITPPYEKYSGHIAYNIRPSQRGKGYATRQLALVLQEARKLCLPFVTLTVENENPASVRVIQKNGGRLLRVIEDPLRVRVKERDGKWVGEDFKKWGVKLAVYVIELA